MVLQQIPNTISTKFIKPRARKRVGRLETTQEGSVTLQEGLQTMWDELETLEEGLGPNQEGSGTVQGR